MLYDFGQGCPAGFHPLGTLAVAKNGDLYGVTNGGGACNGSTIYKLTAPRTRGGAWTQTVLYEYTGNTEFPISMVIDKDGILYGTGEGPNTSGFIFSLTPPRPGKDTWKYAVLYTLNGKSDGSSPQGNLVFDAGGNLYGATELGGDPNCLNGQTCGTVFELKRPNMNGGKWRFSVLHTFTGAPDGAQPFAGVTLDQSGNLYGTTFRGGNFDWGAVYRLEKPTKKGRPWTETTLNSFNLGGDNNTSPASPLILDNSGNLYGTAGGGDLNCQGGFGCGVVFELSPPAKKHGTWAYANLYAFQGGNDGINPSGYMVFDSVGNLYGTTQAGGGTNGGTAYRMSPLGSGGTWTETVLHVFTGISGVSILPDGLIWGKWKDLYGVTEDGGTECQACGTAFEIRP